MTQRTLAAAVMVMATAGAACRAADTAPARTASGYVEATDVRVAAKVAGRVATVSAGEGQRVEAGQILITLQTTETDLAVSRAQAERAQAQAQLRLLQAGTRAEDIEQAEAQQAAAVSDRRAAETEVAAAKADEARFEQLLANNSGSRKQRDDAVSRRQLAEARVRALEDRIRAATAQVARLRAGARPEELDAARARIAAVDAQIATLENDRKEAVVAAPVAGIVTSRLVEPGELVTPRAPLMVIVDLDHAWANVSVAEPEVPAPRVGAGVTPALGGQGRSAVVEAGQGFVGEGRPARDVVDGGVLHGPPPPRRCRRVAHLVAGPRRDYGRGA